MKTELKPRPKVWAGPIDDGLVVAGVLAVLALIPALLVLARVPLPFSMTVLRAFTILALVGVTACAVGMGASLSALGWAHPVNVAGGLLGALALGLITLTILDIRPPWLPGDQTLLAMLAVIVAVKCVLASARVVRILIRNS
jgi:hypothetical protein